jgi:hypothetical protein
MGKVRGDKRGSEPVDGEFAVYAEEKGGEWMDIKQGLRTNKEDCRCTKDTLKNKRKRLSRLTAWS